MITIRRATGRPGGVDSRPGVLFLINDLAIGGAERTIVTFANHLRRFRPVIVVIQPNLDLMPELDPSIDVYSLTTGSGTASPSQTGSGQATRGRPRGQMLLEIPGLLRMSRRLVRLARATDCRTVCTFLNRSHVVALTAKAMSPRLRVVVNVHEMLSDHLDIHFSRPERWLMQRFITTAFPRANRIVTVAGGVKTDLIQNFGLKPDSLAVINNPVDLLRIRSLSVAPVSPASADGATVIGVGRLVELKGFDTLIRAVARLPAHLKANLLIIGEGESRADLERLIAELGVGDIVRMPGAVHNPWAYIARAQVLALSSRTEAFPNVIGEAFALSVPVVATNCSEGVAEYLADGACGLLVPTDDVDALAAALERLLSDDELRHRLTRAGRERVETFAIPRAIADYEALLDSVLP